MRPRIDRSGEEHRARVEGSTGRTTSSVCVPGIDLCSQVCN